MSQLLTRDQFREGVFKRDNYQCVICASPAVDAHHLIERRLWPDQGYYLANGASVCEHCHLNAERTVLSVEQLREAAGIIKPIIPPHLYRDTRYDKWGNPILDNGQRLKGELFFDESVQKILKDGKVLDLFTTRVKYPRTYHLPWSPGVNDDDRVLSSMKAFEGVEAVVTEKMDGENSTLYSDGMHARSIDGRNHASRNWVKNFWATIAGSIPPGWRICGENLYAKHSIHYQDLPTYFMGFSVWTDRNECLDWDSTLEWFQLLDIAPVPVLYRGIYNEKVIRALYDERRDRDLHEGYVLRVGRQFSYGEFRHVVGKFVRTNHVAPSSHHWFGQQIIPNGLKIHQRHDNDLL